MLVDTGSGSVLRLRVGAAAGGWRVEQVASRTVTLTRGPESVKLELPKPALR